MIKVLLISLIFLFLTSCTPDDLIVAKYYEEIDSLRLVENSSESFPFDVQIKLEKLEDEYIYIFTIEKPHYDLKNVKVLVIHNLETNSIFPSVGYFDDIVNVSQNTNKGILLVGYIKKEKIENIKFSASIKIGNEYFYYVKDFTEF